LCIASIRVFNRNPSTLTLVPRSRIVSKYPEDGGDTFLRNVGLHNIYTAPHPEDGILYSHRRENLKSYNLQFFFAVTKHEEVRVLSKKCHPSILQPVPESWTEKKSRKRLVDSA
jgi:hypothetical protein